MTKMDRDLRLHVALLFLKRVSLYNFIVDKAKDSRVI